MTYDQLVAFTTVAAEGTFTSASEVLHKSQPAVSKLIRNLEGMLGMDTTKIDVAPFRRVPIVAVVRADHPIATRRPPIPPSLLRAHPQIVLRDSARGAAPSLNVLEGGLRWTVTDVTAKKDMILAGMGWGGLPEHVVADELANRTL